MSKIQHEESDERDSSMVLRTTDRDCPMKDKIWAGCLPAAPPFCLPFTVSKVFGHAVMIQIVFDLTFSISLWTVGESRPVDPHAVILLVILS